MLLEKNTKNFVIRNQSDLQENPLGQKKLQRLQLLFTTHQLDFF